MKVESLRIRNFKRFKDFEISFKDAMTGEISDRFLILGDNGSGKTTILQAIAYVLGMATQRVTYDDLPKRGWTFVSFEDTHLEVRIRFSPWELEKIETVLRTWATRTKERISTDLKSIFPDNTVVIISSHKLGYSVTNSRGESGTDFKDVLYGRSYLNSLLNSGDRTVTKDWLLDLSDVFLFDQFRHLWLEVGMTDEDAHSPFGKLNRLNKKLLYWKSAASSSSMFKELESLYTTLFPNHRFAEPRYNGLEQEPFIRDEWLFCLNDGQSDYTLAEMSGGEQQLIPLLITIVEERISNSVVLIDEVDLHLHPPLAQRLYTTLPHLLPGSQFIMTTHSRSIIDIADPDNIYRLEGQTCL